jgi:hypothetical protein
VTTQNPVDQRPINPLHARPGRLASRALDLHAKHANNIHAIKHTHVDLTLNQGAGARAHSRTAADSRGDFRLVIKMNFVWVAHASRPSNAIVLLR